MAAPGGGGGGGGGHIGLVYAHTGQVQVWLCVTRHSSSLSSIPTVFNPYASTAHIWHHSSERNLFKEYNLKAYTKRGCLTRENT